MYLPFNLIRLLYFGVLHVEKIAVLRGPKLTQRDGRH
jgi:hypothetical protein